jgi:endonuclease III
MLSSQTTDRVCHTAVKNLRTAVGGSLTVDAILNANRATILVAINKVGFNNKKTGSVAGFMIIMVY